MKKKLYLPRFFQPPKKQSYFLFGPRGTGKSSFLKLKYPNAAVIDLLDDRTLIDLRNDSSRIEPLVNGLKKNSCVIIDEIQKAPQLLSKIHQIIESDHFPVLQFILTGSSARKLKRDGVDLLAGRALNMTMHPFMAAELGSKFNLDNALKYGTIPVIVDSENPKATLESYMATYIREEVLQEGLVRNLDSFSRFLEAISFSHAELLNLSNIARDCSVKRSTVDGFLSILEDLLIAYRIPSFKKQNRKHTVSSEKFYFFDCGIFNTIRPQGPLNEMDYTGAALEGFVLQNLKAWIAYRGQSEQIFFWRTQAGNEVDFVIYGPKTFLAIEVKSTTKIRSSDLSGLNSFLTDYPKAQCLLLYRGKSIETHGQITCIPVQDYLLKLIP